MKNYMRATIAAVAALSFSTSAMALHHQKGHKQGGGNNDNACAADVIKKEGKGGFKVIYVDPNAASKNAYKGKGDQGKGAPVMIRIIPGEGVSIIRGGKGIPHKKVAASKGTSEKHHDGKKLPHLLKCSAK